MRNIVSHRCHNCQTLTGDHAVDKSILNISCKQWGLRGEKFLWANFCYKCHIEEKMEIQTDWKSTWAMININIKEHKVYRSILPNNIPVRSNDNPDHYSSEETYQIHTGLTCAMRYFSNIHRGCISKLGTKVKWL